jgi:hypothetical protein
MDYTKDFMTIDAQEIYAIKGLIMKGRGDGETNQYTKTVKVAYSEGPDLLTANWLDVDGGVYLATGC